MSLVTVEYYGRLAAATGLASEQVSLGNINKVNELIDLITNKYNIEKSLEDCAAAVNDQLVNAGATLNDGDTVALLPPVSGG